MSTRNTKLWRAGESGYINGRYLGLDKRIMFHCKVLETGQSADTSGLAHGFTVNSCRLEITYTVRGLDGRMIEHVWTHGKPVPCSALKTSQY